MLITRRLTTETAHRLNDYSGKCAHIHGHSYEWNVTVSFNDCHLADRILESSGMIMDFGELKALCKVVIHDTFDHAFVISKTDPMCQLCEATDFPIEKLLRPALPDETADGETTPPRLFVMPFNPTAENFSLLIATAFANLFVNNTEYLAQTVSVSCRETENCVCQSTQTVSDVRYPSWWMDDAIALWRDLCLEKTK